MISSKIVPCYKNNVITEVKMFSLFRFHKSRFSQAAAIEEPPPTPSDSQATPTRTTPTDIMPTTTQTHNRTMEVVDLISPGVTTSTGGNCDDTFLVRRRQMPDVSRSSIPLQDSSSPVVGEGEGVATGSTNTDADDSVSGRMECAYGTSIHIPTVSSFSPVATAATTSADSNGNSSLNCIHTSVIRHTDGASRPQYRPSEQQSDNNSNMVISHSGTEHWNGIPQQWPDPDSISSSTAEYVSHGIVEPFPPPLVRQPERESSANSHAIASSPSPNPVQTTPPPPPPPPTSISFLANEHSYALVNQLSSPTSDNDVRATEHSYSLASIGALEAPSHHSTVPRTTLRRSNRLSARLGPYSSGNLRLRHQPSEASVAAELSRTGQTYSELSSSSQDLGPSTGMSLMSHTHDGTVGVSNATDEEAQHRGHTHHHHHGHTPFSISHLLGDDEGTSQHSGRYTSATTSSSSPLNPPPDIPLLPLHPVQPLELHSSPWRHHGTVEGAGLFSIPSSAIANTTQTSRRRRAHNGPNVRDVHVPSPHSATVHHIPSIHRRSHQHTHHQRTPEVTLDPPLAASTTPTTTSSTTSSTAIATPHPPPPRGLQEVFEDFQRDADYYRELSREAEMINNSLDFIESHSRRRQQQQQRNNGSGSNASSSSSGSNSVSGGSAHRPVSSFFDITLADAIATSMFGSDVSGIDIAPPPDGIVRPHHLFARETSTEAEAPGIATPSSAAPQEEPAIMVSTTSSRRTLRRNSHPRFSNRGEMDSVPSASHSSSVAFGETDSVSASSSASLQGVSPSYQVVSESNVPAPDSDVIVVDSDTDEVRRHCMH